MTSKDKVMCEDCKNYDDNNDACFSEAPLYEPMTGINCKYYEEIENG